MDRKYWALPILDGSVPEVDSILPLLAEVGEYSGEVFIHCAEGHGRTALVAVSLLLVRGECATVDDSIKRVLAQRPRAHLNRDQLRFLESLGGRVEPGGLGRKGPHSEGGADGAKDPQ